MVTLDSCAALAALSDQMPAVPLAVVGLAEQPVPIFQQLAGGQVHNHFNQERHHSPSLQAETLCRIGRVARPRSLMARLGLAVLRHAVTTSRYSDEADRG